MIKNYTATKFDMRKERKINKYMNIHIEFLFSTQ